jgi:hypothetical protein
MGTDLTWQQKRDRESFQKWVENETKRCGMDVDIAAMMDNYDPTVSKEANEKFFAENFGLSRYTHEQYRQMHFEQVAGEITTILRDVDEQTVRKIAGSLGYTLRRKRTPHFVVWETYGRRSYYSLEEAMQIEKELKEKGLRQFSSIILRHLVSQNA